MTTKTCNKCKETKARIYFEKDVRNKDGLQGTCSKCRAAYKKEIRDVRRLGHNIIPTETKTCNKCGENKPSSEFYRDSGISDGRATVCKTCRNTKTEEWRHKNKDYYNLKMREYNAKHYDRLRLQRYKITLEQYNQMLTEQNYCCKICNKKPETRRPLAIDHCHKTGKVRGLLCYNCNRIITVLDDPNLLEKAQTYLLEAKHS